MYADIRETPLYREAETLCASTLMPGSGRVIDAVELCVSPTGRSAVFSGTIVDRLEGPLTTRICEIDLLTRDLRVLTYGPHTDRLAKYSPDGRYIAFLSDRSRRGDFQLYLFDVEHRSVRSTPRVRGWVEYLHWSADGLMVLLGEAGHGADLSSGQGAVSSRQASAPVPAWMPSVDTGDEEYRWRRLSAFDLRTNCVRAIGPKHLNVWEATWCGSRAVAAVVSDGPAEGQWYGARLVRIELETGEVREIHRPRNQMGVPCANPSGQLTAFIEGVSSDRGNVAGELHLLDAVSGSATRVPAGGVDVTHLEWRSESRLLLAGSRGFESVVAVWDTRASKLQEVWASADLTAGPRYVTVSGLNESGDFVLVGESLTRAPEIAIVSKEAYRVVLPLGDEYTRQASDSLSVSSVRWCARDGLELFGWVVLPAERAEPPGLVMHVHGGPVSQWRNAWLGRGGLHAMLLLKQGYAAFFPNPRGSSGRGVEFAQRVVGDLGGADTYDLLSGIDHLVSTGVADPRRLGVTGRSYGGFMSYWLITQDSRFAAAVPVAPVSNRVSQRLLCTHTKFVDLFLDDTFDHRGGRYFERSPIMHAHKAHTPTLSICGALDRCTPPDQAMQFHSALRANGVKSAVARYPEEGHGVRSMPATIDFAARVAGWFVEHMGAGR